MWRDQIEKHKFRQSMCDVVFNTQTANILILQSSPKGILIGSLLLRESSEKLCGKLRIDLKIGDRISKKTVYCVSVGK